MADISSPGFSDHLQKVPPQAISQRNPQFQRQPKFIAIDIELSDCFKECLCGNGRMLAVPPIFSAWQTGPRKGWAGFPQEPGPPFT